MRILTIWRSSTTTFVDDFVLTVSTAILMASMKVSCHHAAYFHRVNRNSTAPQEDNCRWRHLPLRWPEAGCDEANRQLEISGRPIYSRGTSAFRSHSQTNRWIAEDLLLGRNKGSQLFLFTLWVYLLPGLYHAASLGAVRLGSCRYPVRPDSESWGEGMVAGWYTEGLHSEILPFWYLFERFGSVFTSVDYSRDPIKLPE